MLNAMFCMLQLRNSYEMNKLRVASSNLLYSLENFVLLKVVFSKSDLECQDSKIFSNCALSVGDNCLLTGGIHFSIANARNKNL